MKSSFTQQVQLYTGNNTKAIAVTICIKGTVIKVGNDHRGDERQQIIGIK